MSIRYQWGIAAAAVAAILASGAALGDDFESVRDNARASVVVVRSALGEGDAEFGTGFVVNDSGVVITNWHVVDGAYSVTVEFPGDPSSKREYGLIDRKPEFDLAALGPREEIPKPKSVACLQSERAGVKEGLPFLMIGHPNKRFWTQHEGSVSRLFKLGEMDALQGNVDASPGSSGSPLFRTDGTVLGMLFAGDFYGLAGLNFIIPSRYVSTLKLDKPVSRFNGEKLELSIGGLKGQQLSTGLSAAWLANRVNGKAFSERIDDTRRVPLGTSGVEYLLDGARIIVNDASLGKENRGILQQYTVRYRVTVMGNYKEKHFRGAGSEYHTKKQSTPYANLDIELKIAGDTRVSSSEVLEQDARGRAVEMIKSGAERKLVELTRAAFNELLQ